MSEKSSIIINENNHKTKIKNCLNSSVGKGDSIIGIAFNISNSTIGTGVLFLPYVISKTGVFFGLIYIAFGGILGFLTVYLLYKSYIKVKMIDSKVTDYEQVGKMTYGRWLSFFIQFCIFTSQFGSCISFTIVIFHILSGWINNFGLRAITLFCVMTPFVICTMSNKIKKLQVLSYISLSTIYVFIFVVILSYFMDWTWGKESGSVLYFPDFTSKDVYVNNFSYLGIVSFAYSCHSSFFCIVGEVSSKNLNKVPISIALAILFDFFVYSLIGCYGYLNFKDNTKTDIILCYSDNKSVVTFVLRILLLIAILSTFPMSGYPCRYAFNNAIIDMIQLCKKKPFNPKTIKIIDILLIVLNTALIVGIVPFIISLTYPFASVIFGLVGSTVAVFLSYIFPCLFYLKLYQPKILEFKTIMIILLLIFGVLFGFGVTTYEIIRLIMFGK